MYKYIKEYQSYVDFYDLLTIKECLRIVAYWQNKYEDFKTDPTVKKPSKKDQIKAFYIALNFDLYTRKTEEYKRKSIIINEWMERDRGKDQILESTSEPERVFCSNCNSKMYVESKELYDISDDPVRVLFFFECRKCKKRKGVFDNSEVFTSTPSYCPECTSELNKTYKRKGEAVTTIYKCTGCRYTKSESQDFAADRKKWDLEKKKDQELLKKYRSEFCLSEKEGNEHLQGIENLKRFSEFMREHERKEVDPVYKKVQKLQKLTVVELEELLAKTLKQHKYKKLVLDKPELSRQVIIPFTAQEVSKRKPLESTSDLQKVLRKTLEGTNWRLMSDGVYYRLGYLYGRFKGYESEEDLANLLRKKVKQEEKPYVMKGERGKIY